MNIAGRIFAFLVALSLLLLAFPAMAFTPRVGTDDPEAFFSCFYLGNIVNDPQDDSNSALEQNSVTFHDGRAIQLYAMGKLTNGHSKTYIESHMGKISDFARALPEVAETGVAPDWYDGRVASLVGLLYCAADDADGDGFSDTLPRATCPAGISSLFPEGSVIDRISPYLNPCCVLSGSQPDETVDFFPCALQ